MSMTDEAAPLERFESLLASEDEEGGPETDAPEDEGQAEDDGEEVEAEAEDEAEAEAEESDDEDEDESDDAEPDGPGEITVDFDGEPLTLTAEEVKSGYLRQADYTRKTQELADQRKAFEAEAQRQIEAINQRIATLNQLQEPEPDWARLRDEDPIGYIQQRDAWMEKQQKVQSLMQQRQQETAAQYQQRLEQERAALMDALPSWRDDAVRQKESAAITETLTGAYGFTPEELNGLADHRLVRVARDAMKYQQLQKSKPGVTKKTAGKPKVAKPGSSSGKIDPKKAAVNKALKRARQEQSPQAWADAFEKFV